jgi:hypothetical protein
MPTELQEALTAAGASALIQKVIDPVLLEYERRYSPLVRALPDRKHTSNVYYFNRRDALVQGGTVVDGGARPVSTSTYTQQFYTIVNFQAVGAVTGYAQEVTADLIGNLRATEIEGAARGLLWDIETAIGWGNAASAANSPYPEFDGMDTIASITTGANQNAIDWNHAAFSLGALDQLIDLVENNVAMPVETTNWMFVMSPTADSRLAQLLTSQQRFTGNAPTVEVAAGLIVPTYRNVPIIKSSFLAPRTSVMGTVTTATATTGGTLAAATYFYRVGAVMARYGEIQASVEVSQAATGSTSVNTLSFSVPAGPDAAQPLHYKVYRSTATGTETLLGYVTAAVALAADGVTPIMANQIVDNGSQLIPQNSTGPTQPAVTPATYVGTNTGIKPLNSGDQNVYLISKDPNFVVRPHVRDLEAVDLYPTTSSPDALPFAFVSDCTFAVRAPRYLGALRATNAVLSS